MNDQDKQRAEIRQQVSHEQISRRAEELWRQYGCPEGRDEAIWLEAEQQLLGTQNTLANESQFASISERLTREDEGNRSGSNEMPHTPHSREVELMKGTAANSVLGGSGSLGGIGGGPSRAPARKGNRSSRASGK